MSKSRVLLLCALGIVCALGFSSCSGSSAISITLSPSTAPTLNPGQTQAITATVANDKNNQGVTWSLSGVGTLSNQTTTSVTYVAPSSVAANTTVTITATSVANTSVTATLNITVNAVFAFSTTSLPAGTLNSPYSGVITATGATGPFTWALTAGALPPGLTLSNSTTASITIVGTPTVVGTSTFTIQVTDSTGASISESLSITINVPPPLSVATRSLPNGMVNAVYFSPQGFQLQASSGTPPYTWTLTSGTLPNGLTLSPAGIISGTPTTVGTSALTFQVTDSSKPNAQTASSGTLNLTITPSTVNNAELKGNYAFLVSGFDAGGPYMAAGSFVADGNVGIISNGIMDINDAGRSSIGVQLGITFSGTYSVDSNNLGTMSFAGRTFAFAMSANPSGTSGRGKIIEFDNTGAQASGVLLQQDTSSFNVALSGPYAFGFLGSDAQGGRYGIAGECTADGSGNFNGGAIDSDDAGTLVSNAACSGISPASDPSTGRGTATIAFSGVSLNFSFYTVSSTQMLFMEIDHASGQNFPHVSGTMLQQAGPSFSGDTVFAVTASQAGTQTAIGEVGIMQASSNALTMNSDENAGGVFSQLSNAQNASYAIGQNGRVTLSGSGITSSDPVLYLAGANQGFIVGTDANVTFGSLENQSGPLPFTIGSLNGDYAGGSIAPTDVNGTNEIDAVVADSSTATLTFTTDSSSNSLQSQNQVSSNNYTILSTGRGQIPASGNPTGILYMVSSTEFFELHSDVNAMIENFQQ